MKCGRVMADDLKWQTRASQLKRWCALGLQAVGCIGGPWIASDYVVYYINGMCSEIFCLWNEFKLWNSYKILLNRLFNNEFSEKLSLCLECIKPVVIDKRQNFKTGIPLK